jgi:hypothetical protein
MTTKNTNGTKTVSRAAREGECRGIVKDLGEWRVPGLAAVRY